MSFLEVDARLLEYDVTMLMGNFYTPYRDVMAIPVGRRRRMVEFLQEEHAKLKDKGKGNA